MPSRPYAAARLTIASGVLTSRHTGTDAADLAARVAESAASCGATVERRGGKVNIHAQDPEDLRARLVVELRALGVLATCHEGADVPGPVVEIDIGSDPRAITLRATGAAADVVEELRAYLDPARTRWRRGTLQLRCVEGGRDRLVEATAAWLQRQGVRVRRR